MSALAAWRESWAARPWLAKEGSCSIGYSQYVAEPYACVSLNTAGIFSGLMQTAHSKPGSLLQNLPS